MIGDGMNKRLEYAKKLVANGHKVFPLIKDSKKPLVGSNGFKDATDDLDQIEQWWGNNPEFNIGIRTGEVSNLTVIDVDKLSGGVKSIESVMHLLPKDTWMNKTPHGGHLCFEYNSEVKHGVGFLDGIDVRNDGGYIVAPTSYVICDKSYCDKNHSYDYTIHKDRPKQRILVVPEVFKSNTNTKTSKVNIPEILNGVPEGSRDQTAFALIDQLFRLGVPQNLARPIVHNFADNCQPPLPHRVVDEKIDRLPQIYDYPDPVKEDDDPIEEAYKRMQFTHPTEWLNEEEIEETFVVEDLIPSGALVMVTSFPKAGKSTFTRNLSMAVARGEDFIGRKVKQGKVLYLALEEQPNKVKRSFRRMGLEADDPLQIMFGKPSREAVDDLRVIVQQEKPVMVVIDTVTRMPKGKFEMNDYFSNSEWLDPYMYMAHDLGVAILVNYHCSRNGRSLEGVDAIAAPIGSTGILATPDQIINIKVESDHTRNISSMGRFEPFPPTLVDFDRETERLIVIGEKSGITHRKVRQDIIENCSDTAWKNQKDVFQEVEGKASDKQKALAELLAENLVHRQGEGKKGSFYEIRTGEIHFPLPTIEIEKGNEILTPIKMERLEFDV